jgi:hypothetical protein
MTFAELKIQLDALTPEQLACEAVWCGDERGGKIKSLWIADQDWIDNDGECEPRSVVPDFEGDVVVLIPMGTPQLWVD